MDIFQLIFLPLKFSNFLIDILESNSFRLPDNKILFYKIFEKFVKKYVESVSVPFDNGTNISFPSSPHPNNGPSQ